MTAVLTEQPTIGPEPSEPELPRAVRVTRKLKRNWFAAFWRWHFYAAIIVIPALFVLSITGLLMLYKAQIDPIFHPGVILVQVPADGAARLPLSTQQAAVQAAFPDRTIGAETTERTGRQRSSRPRWATVFGTCT